MKECPICGANAGTSGDVRYIVKLGGLVLVCGLCIATRLVEMTDGKFVILAKKV